MYVGQVPPLCGLHDWAIFISNNEASQILKTNGLDEWAGVVSSSHRKSSLVVRAGDTRLTNCSRNRN